MGEGETNLKATGDMAQMVSETRTGVKAKRNVSRETDAVRRVCWLATSQISYLPAPRQMDSFILVKHSKWSM